MSIVEFCARSSTANLRRRRKSCACRLLRAEELVARLLTHTSSQSARDELDGRMVFEVVGAAVRVAFTSWVESDGAASLAELFQLCLSSPSLCQNPG